MENKDDEMRKFEEALSVFHIPRFEDLPDIELYMDQVIALLNKSLAIISNNENIITPSMVNNYVKFNLIPAPKGKRYSRKHLCYMIALYFLKQILSMNEIKTLVNQQLKHYSELQAYNLFCSELEKAFKKFTTKENEPITTDEKTHCLIHCAKAIAYKLHAQKFISLINTEPPKEKKQEKKVETEKRKGENNGEKDKKSEKKIENNKK